MLASFLVLQVFKLGEYLMSTDSQSVPSTVDQTTDLGTSALQFVSGNSKFIYGTTNGEIFYQPPSGEGFYEVYQAKFWGDTRCHHLIFEYFKDGKLVRHQLWRNNSLVVIDGVKLGRKKDYSIGSGDAGINFVYAYGDDFIFDSAAIASSGLTQEDVIANAPGNIRRLDRELVYGGVEYTSLKAPSSVTYKPLPEARVPVYLFRLAGGQLVYLSADCHHYNWHTCKLFYGKGSLSELSELAIQSFESASGKTSYAFYLCKESELSTLLIDDNLATYSFRGEPLELLDIRNFDFVESSGVALVSPKSD